MITGVPARIVRDAKTGRRMLVPITDELEESVHAQGESANAQGESVSNKLAVKTMSPAYKRDQHPFLVSAGLEAFVDTSWAS
jgi:hypothetical protein